jgi:hypothetical protein
MSINLDNNTLGNNGSNGICRLASGIGAITTASGDTVNLVISGVLCLETLAPPLVVHASFAVNSGTGKLANARGTGAIDFSINSAQVGTTTGDLVMNGAFAKK